MPRRKKDQGSVWAGVLPDGRTLGLVREYTEEDAIAAFHDSANCESLHMLKEGRKKLWPYPPQFRLTIRPATPEEETQWQASWDADPDLPEECYVSHMCFVTGKLPKGYG